MLARCRSGWSASGGRGEELPAGHADPGPGQPGDDLRDLYNLEDPFHVGPDYRDAYRARLDANLAYMDRFDGIIGRPLGNNGEHPLTELFLADQLVVDVSRPYAEDGFLGIERAVLAGRRHRGCGGRSINDDVMDALYTFVFGGLDAPRSATASTRRPGGARRRSRTSRRRTAPPCHRVRWGRPAPRPPTTSTTDSATTRSA